LLILFSLMGASVVPSMSSVRLMHGFIVSLRSLEAKQSPDFSYLPQTSTADLSSRSDTP
jgi:hypothetical protein